ncbi:MAG: lipid-binding SYLF domain-containing protein [Paraglaciecola sp.]|jgi:lipid-binding SYLF domain-containing protein
MSITQALKASIIAGIFLAVSGCASNKATIPEQRMAVLTMSEQVLSELFAIKPSVQAQISQAAGYGVFDNANVNLLIASFGGGYGVVKDNTTGQQTYMKMAEAGLGLGAGVKDFRVVFIFHNNDVLKRFVDQGWAFGAQADAAAKAGDKGAAIGGEVTVDNITIYQLTKSGLALQATVKGTKYWQDDTLN